MDQPHALVVASPGLGHLIPALELGNRLSSILNINVTILAITSGSSSLTETEMIHAAAARGTCEIMELPSVDIDHLLEPDATVVTKIVTMMRAMKPAVRDAVKSMKQKPSVMIVDFFGTALTSITDVGVTNKYVYIPSHAWFLALMVYLPVLDKAVEGSGGTLSLEQTMELAWGLELSGQSFLWVLRRPVSYLGGSSKDDDQVSTCLPEGFLDRTRGVGLVVTEWAPQVEILSHRSIGGFLSHCGWSSVLESLTKGVPIVAWPLYAEQWMNATLLTEEIGVAIRTSDLPSKKVIGREEVAYLVKKIVAEEDKGRKIKAKAEEVRVSSERAWTHGGSSHSSLFEWAKQCRLVS